jgi:RNA polymerase sigma-70 factor (ECF subfamily)
VGARLGSTLEGRPPGVPRHVHGDFAMNARSLLAPAAVSASPSRDRVQAAVLDHYEFLWRCLRRLGVAEATVEDALQKVLMVFVDRQHAVPDGSERAFLFGTAVRVAADWRKKEARSREVAWEGEILSRADGAPDAEALLDQRQARELLQQALDQMPIELRVVFVLAELEEMTLPSIASLVGVPLGTASSRLRRARACFADIAARMKDELSGPGGTT